MEQKLLSPGAEKLRAVPKRERRNVAVPRPLPPVAVAGEGTAAVTGRLIAWLLPACLGMTAAVLPAEDACRAGALGALVLANFDSGGGVETPPELLEKSARVVVSLDHPLGRTLKAALPEKTFTYSDGDCRADLTAENLQLRDGLWRFEGVTADDIARLRSPGFEECGVYPVLAAVGCVLSLGGSLRRCAEALDEAQRQKGQRDPWSALVSCAKYL